MLTSNASGNLITPVYDLSGDTANDGKNNYLYDAEGRVCAAQSLLSGTITGYLYDAGGNRVAKGTLTSLSCDTNPSDTATYNGFTLTAQYLLGPGGEQMTELNSTGAWVHTNVTANGTLFASFDNDGKGVHFFLTDWLGTRRVQTNYLGAVENTWTSLPYGDALTPSGTDDPTEQHFTGKERDSESGLDYFGARYYGSSMGRFMSPDWAAKAEPVPYAKLNSPQSLNLYAFVRNNPLMYVDTDGHDVVQYILLTSGPNQVPSAPHSEVKNAKTLGPQETGDGFYFLLNTQAQFDTGDNPADWKPIRTAYILESGETRSGRDENPDKNQIANTGNSQFAYDNPGFSFSGVPKASVNGAIHIAFSYTETNTKTNTPSTKMMYYFVSVKVENGKIVASTAQQISKAQFTQLTTPNKKKKDPTGN